MNSNNNTHKRKTLLHWYEKKTFGNQKDKTKSNTLKKPRIAAILSIEFDNEVKQYSTTNGTNNTKKNNKQDGFDQIQELKGKFQIPGRSKKGTLNTRYQLNFKNYIQELHNALIKECDYNLLNLNSFNLTLDFESLTSVTNRTLKAIKVLENK